MKIRIKGNALRFRLTRSEVEKFTHTGRITDQVNFGLSSLQYALVATGNHQLSAAFENNCISIFLPAALSAGWHLSDRIGFEAVVDLPATGEQLFLLVEKDFTCMEKVNEDQSDNYPNPLVKELYGHN